MSIATIATKQYRDRVNRAAIQFAGWASAPDGELPREGWLRTVRKALGVTGTQLAKKLGVTKARVSRAEHDEPQGSVTLKTMQTMAEAMDCRFIYAVVPKQTVEEVLKNRALEKARARVATASTHMALEAQSLSREQLEFEVERVAAEILREMPRDFWDDK